MQKKEWQNGEVEQLIKFEKNIINICEVVAFDLILTMNDVPVDSLS